MKVKPTENEEQSLHRPFRIDDLHIETVERDDLDEIRVMNEIIFGERRLINRLDHDNLIILIARLQEMPVGFKIGYGVSRNEFYSAKGGIMMPYRRQGIARRLLHYMIMESRKLGYTTFSYDTFPNRDRGMLILGLNEGFKVTSAQFDQRYGDYQLRLVRKMREF
jgi:GNAT superfamily N-acetyltransferase